jgi:NAD(P)-dependent dehydrogenase (short-subunit alcohol dehydrogenase family)
MLPEDARMRGQTWEDYLAGCSNRPLGRIGTSDEIAKAALFLDSRKRRGGHLEQSARHLTTSFCGDRSEPDAA